MGAAGYTIAGMLRFVCLILLAAPLLGQGPSARGVGRVVEASRAGVPRGAVKISNLDTNQTYRGSSNGSGDYTVLYLIPGRYSLEALAQGFRDYKRSEFTLQVDQELRLDIKLEVGATTETVTVKDAPTALNTESGMRGDVTDRKSGG